MPFGLIHQSEDIEYGRMSELAVLPLINKHFNDDAVASSEIYSTQDFFSQNAVYELKSRKIVHNLYPTALIGANKAVLKKDDREKSLYFVFSYLDGLFYIKYDEEQFRDWKSVFQRNARIGCRDLAHEVFHIPHTALTRINE
jgi:hypothetical protein